MYSAKHAHQYLDKVPDGRCYVFYMDVRTPGKGYDEFYMNTLHDGAQYIRGRVSKIYQEGDKLICKGEDTLTSTPVTVAADMVVLETAMVPAEGIDELAAKFTVGRDADGWLVEAHAKLRPVETNTAGIYLAGKFGVRIENLVVVREAERTEFGRFLKLEPLTLVPYDRDAIDLTMLSSRDVELLNDYHAKVCAAISPYLQGDELNWLKEVTAPVALG